MAGKNRWWLLLVAFSFVFGCASAGAKVSLGQEFQLAPDQSVIVKGEDLAIRFIGVTADSRCPQGATCIWAGEAKSQVEITYSGTTYHLTLTQPGHSEPPQTSFQNYEVTFNLLPYPRVGEEIQSGDYRLQLTVRRKPVLR